MIYDGSTLRLCSVQASSPQVCDLKTWVPCSWPKVAALGDDTLCQLPRPTPPTAGKARNDGERTPATGAGAKLGRHKTLAEFGEIGKDEGCKVD
jgi:hypothetical protein